MKPYRNLFYILTTLFIIGIVWVCLADPSSVMSRIASGLITGSFVGAITMFVNYMHLRTSYFEKMSTVLTKIGQELGNDYLDAVLNNEELASSSVQEVVNGFINRTTEQKRALKSGEKKYEKLIKKINMDAFAGISPSDIAVKNKFGDLEDILLSIEEMYARYRSNPYFKSLPARTPSALQAKAIGAPQKFYDNWVKSNRELQDAVASQMKELKRVCEDLSNSLMGTISKDVASVMSFTSDYYLHTDLDDLECATEEQDSDEEPDLTDED